MPSLPLSSLAIAGALSSPTHVAAEVAQNHKTLGIKAAEAGDQKNAFFHFNEHTKAHKTDASGWSNLA